MAGVNKPERGEFDNRYVEQAGWAGTASTGTTTIRENFDRASAFSVAVAAAATQVMNSYGIILYQGDVISNIAMRTGTTALATPTNWWFALYNPAGGLMAQTADQLTTAWGASTNMDLPLATPQTIQVSGLHYAAVMLKGGTMPTFFGSILGSAAAGAGVISGQGAKAQTSGSALTTTAPATIASPTAQIGCAYVVCH